MYLYYYSSSTYSPKTGYLNSVLVSSSAIQLAKLNSYISTIRKLNALLNNWKERNRHLFKEYRFKISIQYVKSENHKNKEILLQKC